MSIYINVNRKIYLALNKELREEYLNDQCGDPIYDFLQTESSHEVNIDSKEVAKAIFKTIEANEEWHEKYGVLQKNGLKQVDEDISVPGFSEVSGFRQIGRVIICPEDWSWDEDGSFNYSFGIAIKL